MVDELLVRNFTGLSEVIALGIGMSRECAAINIYNVRHCVSLHLVVFVNERTIIGNGEHSTMRKVSNIVVVLADLYI